MYQFYLNISWTQNFISFTPFLLSLYLYFLLLEFDSAWVILTRPILISLKWKVTLNFRTNNWKTWTWGGTFKLQSSILQKKIHITFRSNSSECHQYIKTIHLGIMCVNIGKIFCKPWEGWFCLYQNLSFVQPAWSESQPCLRKFWNSELPRLSKWNSKLKIPSWA